MEARYPTAAVIGAQIQLVRKAQGLSVRSLAVKAGMPHTNLLKIEQGQVNIPIETLQRLAAALGVPLVVLLPHDDPKPEAALAQCVAKLGEAVALLHQAGLSVSDAQAFLALSSSESAQFFLFPRAWRIPGWPVRLALPPFRPALAYAG